VHIQGETEICQQTLRKLKLKRIKSIQRNLKKINLK